MLSVIEHLELPVAIGTKIWRPADKSVSQGILFIEPWDYLRIDDSKDRSGRPVKVLRAKRRPWDQEWIARDAKGTGVICFCYERIPSNWTYLEIVEVHPGGRRFTVRPIAGDASEYRRMF